MQCVQSMTQIRLRNVKRNKLCMFIKEVYSYVLMQLHTYDIQVYFYSYFSIDSRTFNKSESLKSINIWLKWNFLSIICNCRCAKIYEKTYDICPSKICNIRLKILINICYVDILILYRQSKSFIFILEFFQNNFYSFW